MKLVGLNNLCTPAFLYLLINAVALFLIAYQNYGNISTYCVGSYSCNVSNTYLVFFIKVVYILFWTWILNLLCSNGFTQLSWFLFLLPFILLFIFIAFMMIYNTMKYNSIAIYNNHFP